MYKKVELIKTTVHGDTLRIKESDILPLSSVLHKADVGRFGDRYIVEERAEGNLYGKGIYLRGDYQKDNFDAVIVEDNRGALVLLVLKKGVIG